MRSVASPFAPMGGMGADSAHLGIAREQQALAAHRHELAVHAYPEIRSHAIRAGTEKSRKGELGERHHLLRIARRESGVISRPARGTSAAARQHHLHALEAVDDGDPRRLAAVVRDPDRLAGAEQGSELIERTPRARRLDRRERCIRRRDSGRHRPRRGRDGDAVPATRATRDSRTGSRTARSSRPDCNLAARHVARGSHYGFLESAAGGAFKTPRRS